MFPAVPTRVGLKPTPSDCKAGRADSCSIACDLCDLGQATSLPDTSGNSAVRRGSVSAAVGPWGEESSSAMNGSASHQFSWLS